jgi:hypothetical protein
MEIPSQVRTRGFAARWLLLAAVVAVPVTLLWDYAWESTIGIDLVWSPPHTANYVAMAMAGIVAGGWVLVCTRRNIPAVRLGKLQAPLGIWIVLWGALAYFTAVLFDRWWQVGYGLAAGIWHPPQLLKAVAYFAVAIGAWVSLARGQQTALGGWAFALAGGVVLALVNVVTLVSNFANCQHGSAFYQIACGTYPIVLAAAAVAGRFRFSATATALCYTLIVGGMVWVSPLIPGTPLTGPIYHPRDHLLPPPFPLLLLAPAVALDVLLRAFPGRGQEGESALEAGLAFFFVFAAVQWPFAKFLLSPASANWFFAGGGEQWPVFIRSNPAEHTRFWRGYEFTSSGVAIAAGLALLAAAVGLWIGARMKRLR